MIFAVKKTVAAIAACIVVAGCSSDVPAGEDVTAPGAATGAVAVKLRPLAPERFDGTPTRIGFEPVELVGGDFQTLMGFVFLPDSDAFIAVNRGGKVGLFDLESDVATLRASFQIPAVHVGGTCGASAVALDPDFGANKNFYVSYCIDSQYNVVKRFTLADHFPDTVYSSSNVIAAGDSRAGVARNAVGGMAFAPDGALWMNVGDHGRKENARDTTNELGAILRLSPQKQPTQNGYTVPKGNPFSKDPDSRVVYAYGFRDPWRGAFDARGRYWVADDGDDRYEEIDVVTGPGQDFGWPDSEGPACESDCSPFVLPVRFWDSSASHPFVREDALAKNPPRFRRAWVGLEYNPQKSDPYKGLLTGKMLYGDFFVGFVRGIALDGEGEVVSDQHLGHLELPVAWQQGRDGYVYAATMYAGFDQVRAADGDETLASQRQQGKLWRAIPLP